MGVALLPSDVLKKFEVAEKYHAASILQSDFPAEWDDLTSMLAAFVLRKSDIITPGGSQSRISSGIDAFFYARGWSEHDFKFRVEADGVTKLAPTHKVDYYKNRVAVETEWNNKDPFFDRDLTTFRLLFELNVISVGVIITRASELQDIFVALGRGTSFGNSTTHMGKLLPKLENRASGGCPVLAFGIKSSAYDPDN